MDTRVKREAKTKQRVKPNDIIHNRYKVRARINKTDTRQPELQHDTQVRFVTAQDIQHHMTKFATSGIEALTHCTLAIQK